MRKFYIKFSKDQISICGLGLNRLFCCFGKKASEVLTMTTSNTRKLFIFYTRVKKTDVLITFHFTSFHILLLLLTFLFHVLYWKNERERGFYTTITFYCLAFWIFRNKIIIFHFVGFLFYLAPALCATKQQQKFIILFFYSYFSCHFWAYSST